MNKEQQSVTTQNILFFFDGKPEEIDQELMGWIQEAAAFSAGKR